MWVYQQTSTAGASPVPSLPETLPAPALAREAIEGPEPREAPASPGQSLSADLPETALPGAARARLPRRGRSRQASRDCILLGAAYLFGTLMAGVLQALCDAGETETLACYLDCWRSLFALAGTSRAVELFSTELAVVVGAAAVLLFLGLSALGPMPIFFFAMLYGTGSGLLSAQLLAGLGGRQLLLFLLAGSLPAALAAGGLCVFGASALQVSSRIRAFSFGHGGQGSSLRPAGARLLLGQFALLAVLLCPLCGAATGLACLASRFLPAG